jgi:hypothetical protein
LGVGFRDVGIRYVQVFFFKREQRRESGVCGMTPSTGDDMELVEEERCGCDATELFQGK